MATYQQNIELRVVQALLLAEIRQDMYSLRLEMREIGKKIVRLEKQIKHGVKK